MGDRRAQQADPNLIQPASGGSQPAARMSAERTLMTLAGELRLLALPADVRGSAGALGGRHSLLLADRLLDKRIDSQRRQHVRSAGGEVR